MPQYRPFQTRFRAARHACRVAGEPVEAAALDVRNMNFGQHFRTPGLPVAPFEVRVERALVAAFLDEELREQRASAEQDGGDLLDFERALIERGWPAPAEVLEDRALGAAIVRYFGFELVLSCLSAEPGSAPRWVLSSVDEVEIEGDDVILRGQAGRADLRRAYQDF